MIHWALGAITVLAMYWTMFRARAEQERDAREELEETVATRTIQLRGALEESESFRRRNATLLQELNHRTKNNLQLIASLISLQQTGTFGRAHAPDRLLDTIRHRVLAMATVHELLHHSDQSTAVPLYMFTRELADGFMKSGIVDEIELDVEGIEDTAVDMDFAVPLALVLNELVTNAAQHASEPGESSRVRIQAGRQENVLQLSVIDYGRGMPETFALDSIKTSGLKIVRALVGQLDGELEMKRSPSTTWEITIPLPTLKR